MPITHPDTHIILGPGQALSRIVGLSGVRRLNKAEILTRAQFDQFISLGMVPEYAVVWGFINFNDLLRAWCRNHGVKITYGEMGWFPHYESFALDPEGFCWNSLISKTPYVGDTQQPLPEATQHLDQFKPERHPLPPEVNGPFVLWAGQMVSDKVNDYGLDAKDWCRYIEHFRGLLPKDIQLVIRPHPKASHRPSQEKDAHYRMVDLAQRLPNTIITHLGDLNSLIAASYGVAGMNSTVLLEARILHGKNVWAYAPSWYTGHEDLIHRLHGTGQDRLVYTTRPQLHYRKWLLEEFLQRQIIRDPEPTGRKTIRRWLDRWSAVPGRAVPRLAHFIWLGDKVPSVYLKNLREFQQLNPDVQTILHSCPPPDMHNEPDALTAYERAYSPQQKADVLRAWLLHKYGGVYFDLDFAWIRPLPDILFRSGPWCGSNHRTPYENGEVGCAAGCSEMHKYLDAIYQQSDLREFHALGPPLLHRVINDGAQFQSLPWWWFNPGRCEQGYYRHMLHQSIEQRQQISDCPLIYEDGQLPVAQHLHGSINDQYRETAHEPS